MSTCLNQADLVFISSPKRVTTHDVMNNTACTDLLDFCFIFLADDLAASPFFSGSGGTKLNGGL